MRYAIIMAQADDKSWGALVPDLPGLLLVGDTCEELLANAPHSISMHIEATKEAGLPIQAPSSYAAEVEVAA